MNKQIELQTLPRSKYLNLKKSIPAIVYGGKSGNDIIEIDAKTIEQLFYTNAFHTHVIELVVDKKKTPVLLKDWQLNPISRKVIHMDFYRVSLNKPVDIDVPLRIIGEEHCTAITDEKGVLQLHITEMNVQCLPNDIPEHIDIDISELALKASIHASEIAEPKGVSFNMQIDETHDPALVSIQPPLIEEPSPEELEEDNEDSTDIEESTEVTDETSEPTSESEDT